MQYYAQTNYLQIQGRVSPSGVQPKFKISEIGCLLAANCNLEVDFGRPVDPLTLNAFYRDHLVYGDVDDKVYDDLSWSSIITYDPRITILKTGDGYPDSDNSIVKFTYVSKRTGFPTTHFSKVHSAKDRTIVDSWDGQIKPMAAYGVPTSYATYGSSNPQPITPVIAASPAANNGRQLFLPAAAGTWRIYNEAGPYVVGKEIAKLWPGNPQWAPGLTFDIIRTLAPNVYLIHTESKGDAAIYAGPDTIAQFHDKPAPPAPAPTPAPVIQAAPAVATPVTEPMHVEVAEPAPSVPEAVPVVPIDWHKVDTTKAGKYLAKAEITIKDADGLAMPVVMHKNDTVTIAGTFKPKDVEFYISVKSVKNGTWYAIPMDNMSEIKTDQEEEEALDKVLDELFGKKDSEEASKPIVLPTSKNTIRNALSKVIGYLHGVADRMSGKNKNKELGR